MRLSIVPAVALAAGTPVDAETIYNVISYYFVEKCSGTPNRVDVELKGSCHQECTIAQGDWISQSYACGSDYKQKIWDSFDGSAFILQEAFSSGCETLLDAFSALANGKCAQVITTVPAWGFATYLVAQLNEDGSASVRYFNDSDCTMPLENSVQLTVNSMTKDVDIDKARLGSKICDADGLRWSYYDSSHPYVPVDSSGSSNSDPPSSAGTPTPTSNNMVNPDKSDSNNAVPTSSSPRNNTGVIIGVVGGVLAVLLFLLGFIYLRRRSSEDQGAQHNTRSGEYLDHITPAGGRITTTTKTANSSEKSGGSLGQSGMWDDDVITAKRISRRKVLTSRFLSRGAFGEVYEGTYNDKRVAVKLLAPDMRGVISHVNNFLAEAKMTATMDHPRIVTFVGVAWDSLSDLCVVMEYMEGGDLRTLLSKYEEANHPVGINQEKATIALHVCHALTYLHSLSPPVIHRDLKSRNILLNSTMEAKLTDFGISREHMDQTMTANVGTSLWMAPEVMMGEKYDAKADMFSFGVVLSELDLHTLPYAQEKEKYRESNGRQMPEAVIMQQVAIGSARVHFSKSSPPSLVELGLACVSIDPNLRPTAAEALYKLHLAISELRK